METGEVIEGGRKLSGDQMFTRLKAAVEKLEGWYGTVCAKATGPAHDEALAIRVVIGDAMDSLEYRVWRHGELWGRSQSEAMPIAK